MGHLKHWHVFIIGFLAAFALWYFNPGGVVCSVKTTLNVPG
jgi:hypothetical protein